MMFRRIKHIHFIGIGGTGMCGIAEILLNQNFKVTGSDLRLTDVTERLAKLGATITEGHHSDNVLGADVIVYSSAVKENNPEIEAAKLHNIPVIRRAVMLAELMRMKYGICIAGTHGKTTTTSMTGLVLTEGALDPTILVGGRVNNFDSNVKPGLGDFVVVEADEFDRSFLELMPSIAVITNIESDHLDCYENLDEIKDAFVDFANKVPFYGVVIICLDEAGDQSILHRIKKRVWTYGRSSQSDLYAYRIESDGFTTKFWVARHQKPLGEIQLQVPGEHNVKNALAAMSVGMELDIPFEKIKKALESFKGVYRRFEIKGQIDDITIVDDFAHHPTEIQVTLRAARDSCMRNIIAIFQPHLYSRTRDFYEEFGGAFYEANMLIVTDIYPAREVPIPGVTGELIANSATMRGHRNVHYVPNKKKIADYVLPYLKGDDIIITLGAGDIWKYGEEIRDKLLEKKG